MGMGKMGESITGNHRLFIGGVCGSRLGGIPDAHIDHEFYPQLVQ